MRNTDNPLDFTPTFSVGWVLARMRITALSSFDSHGGCCSAQSWSGCSVVLVYLFYLVYLENYLFNSSHVQLCVSCFFFACVSPFGAYNMNFEL